MDFFKRIKDEDIKKSDIQDKDDSTGVKVLADNEEDEKEIAAIISATIAMFIDADTSNFKVKSIVRMPDTSPIWNRVGRQEQIYSRFFT